MNRNRTHRFGFSLIELSVVLGIIALIAGTGMSMANGSLKAADRITTQERLATIKTALDSYARLHGYLPCPFDRALTPASAAFGVEGRAGGTCVAAGDGLKNADNTWFGGLPVRTLGLPDTYAADAWDNKLTYAVSANHMNAITNYATSAGSLSIRYGDRTSWSYSTSQRISVAYTNANNGGNAQLTLPQAAAAGTIIHLKSTSAGGYNGSYFVNSAATTTLVSTDAARTNPLGYNGAGPGGTAEWLEPGSGATYVVISHGPDGRGAYPLNATAIPDRRTCNTGIAPPPCISNATTSCIDIENCNDSNGIFYDTAYNDGKIAAQYFDDYIIWGSNALMRQPANTNLYPSCSGRGVCEAWCAQCSTNYPGASATVPPPAITGGNAQLCKKIITSNSTDCSATCFWSGTTASGYQPCP